MQGRCSLVRATILGVAAFAIPGVAQTQQAATGRLQFEAREATWMAPDIAPDGRTILFDLLGDIYALDAAGGTARPLLTGDAFETQPVFSPDGRQIAFISDRSGAANLWVANADGSNARKLSGDTDPAIYTSPAWSPDSRFVYVSRTIHNILAFELFAYDPRGGSGVKVTQARPTGNEGNADRINAMGAAASPDGKYLYYARKTGGLWSDKVLPHWEIMRRTLATGAEDRIITSPGAAMRPALSRDGTRIVYASRWGAQTGLRIRDLETGADRWLSFPVDHDSQMGGYYNDLVPRVAFLPGDREVLTAIDGKLTRIRIADGVRSPVPFTAAVDLAVRRNTRVEVPDETGPVRVRVIQAPRLSPDGSRIAFAALGKLYVQDRTGGTPRAVAGVEGMAFQPAWSPDGRTLVYVTWTGEGDGGGTLWSIPTAGGKPRRLLQASAYYSEPTVSPDGRSVAVLRATSIERLQSASDLQASRPTDVVLLPLAGGEARVIASKSGIKSLSFDAKGEWLRYMGGPSIEAVAVQSGMLRRVFDLRVPNSNRYFNNIQTPPEDIRLSPDGTRMLVKAASQAWLLDVPPSFSADPQALELARPVVFGVRLTDIGADYVDWSRDGKTLMWSLGATVRTIDAAQAATLTKGLAEKQAAKIEAVVELPRDVPQGSTVLRGGTVITMRGDETIAGADVVVTANRIVAIGKTGEVTVPTGATVIDVSGKYLTPGFVDTHAHWFELPRQVLEANHWSLLANLAYGVTSGLDVQPFTIDVFGYQDMIDAGIMVGPRAFSTGPGIFVNSEINSAAEAEAVLTRYRDYYRTSNLKAYLVGNRTQRKLVVEASDKMAMMATTEGASDFNLNLTHAIDGMAGNEHNLPITPLREDVVKLYASSRIGYTPTFGVLYGGFAPYDDQVIAGEVDRDAKLAHFVPQGIIESKMRDRVWVPPMDRTSASFAADALRIRRAGGLVGMGSHAVIQGLGYHYEMRAYAEGGATPHEVLRAATLDSAEAIGRKSMIGSIEPGKYADILIMSANPLEKIENAAAIDKVMKNGRIYNAATLSEEWPRKQALPDRWFARARPDGGSTK
ncbi:amidohydrolase family protein [Sphingomonas sp. BT-65]|uniref:LpqB family beta-propeller domain-containing protein n=1 Tax=Sphingomonas sp. BT-65 TaxID=2989821 RepID=UPI00223688E4|nr:LpqB family beta-propeller domain-containing protein [Sphingomonas sp. BT-65]MCW4460680.1 amidohydrolase family protein [Sphingomonas sp. BT-65]